MPGVDKYAEPYARMLNNAGLRKWRMGNYDEARSVLEKSLAIWLQLGRRGELGQAEALNRLGMVANWGDKDTNKAESYFNQSLTLFQKAEEPWGIAWNLFHLGGIAINRRQSEVALSLLQQSFDLYRELGDPWGMGRVSQFLGVLYLKQADYKKAQFYFDQQLKYDESLRFLDGVSMALLNLGELYRFQGDYAQAEVNYERSLKISREHGMKIDIGANLYNLGLLALQQNDYSEALRFFNEYFKSVRTANGNIATRNLFIGLAAVAAGTNQPERAAKLSGAAQAIFDTTDNLFSPFDRAVLDRHIQVSRNDFGKEAFDVLVMEGRQMFVEQALAYALAE
jgi:tetratricopeptide (TPR) repeat protein